MALLAGVDFLTPETQVLVWTLIVFGALVGILWKYAWGPLLKALEGREKSIQARFDEAARKIEDAERRVVEYEEKIGHIKDEAAEIVAEAKRDAERLREDIQARAEKEAQMTLGRAKREIHLAKEAAVQELRDGMVDLTAELAARVIEREVNKDDHRRFIENAVCRVAEEGQ